MQDAHGIFSLRLGVEIKLWFMLYFFILSMWSYICLRGWNKKFAAIFAAAVPAYAIYGLFRVALENVLDRF